MTGTESVKEQMSLTAWHISTPINPKKGETIVLGELLRTVVGTVILEHVAIVIIIGGTFLIDGILSVSFLNA